MIRVMSFNIRTASADTGLHAWSRRRAAVVAAIQTFAPDLLGMQECRDDGQAQDLREALPDYHWHAVTRGGQDESRVEMAPLLWRRTAFRLRRAGHFWFGASPQTPGTRAPGADYPRTVSWAELETSADGRVLLAVNTHLDCAPAAIDAAVEQLAGWLDAQAGDRPVVLCGDFNAERGGAAHQRLTTRVALSDTLIRCRPALAALATYQDFADPQQCGALDWILVSGQWRCRDAEVIGGDAAAWRASDHRPVVACIEPGPAPA